MKDTILGILSRIGSSPKNTGIDIGTSSIKIATLSSKRNKYVIESAHLVPIRPNIFFEGRIEDKEAFKEELSNIYPLIPKTGKKILVIPGTQSMVKSTQIPQALPDDKIDEYIFDRVISKMPFAANEISYDFFTSNDNGKRLVTIVIGKKSLIDELTELFSQNGVFLDVVTSIFVALTNTLLVNYPESTKKSVIIIDIGYVTTNLVCINKGILTHARSIDVGTVLIEQMIANTTGGDPERIREALHKGEVDEHLMLTATKECAESIASEVVSYAAFCEGEQMLTEMQRAFVFSGGGIVDRKLLNEILMRLPDTYEAFGLDPLTNISISDKFDKKLLEEMRYRFTIAIGAAL